MTSSTKVFLSIMDNLGSYELDQPSGLPGWGRRHVIAHVHVGVGFADLPDELNAALVAVAAAKHCAKGHAADLAAWLTGRTSQAPTLGTWI